MKKLFLLLALACSTGITYAQAAGSSNKTKTPVDEATVPAKAKDAFHAENPDEEVTWIVDGKNYKAEYVDDSNVSHARIYDGSGNILFLPRYSSMPHPKLGSNPFL